MHPYICITHAQSDRNARRRLIETLSGYGFEYRFVELSSVDASVLQDPAIQDPIDDPIERSEKMTDVLDPSVSSGNPEIAENIREKILQEAAVIIRLITSDTDRTEQAYENLRIGTNGRQADIHLIFNDSRAEETTEIDSGEAEGMVRVRFPFVLDDTQDAHRMSLLIHRLFVQNRDLFSAAFSASDCRQDAYGRVVTFAMAAHAGNAMGMYALACAYEQGLGVPRMETEAAVWLASAAERGYIEARLHQAEWYRVGGGPDGNINFKEAFSIYRTLAEEGCERGQYCLGLCYLNGIGVIADPVQAVAYIRRSADRGYAPALYRLGILYRDGIGIERSPCDAADCFCLACRRGVRTMRDDPFEELLGAIPDRSLLPTLSLYAKWQRHGPVRASMRHMRRHHVENRLIKRMMGECERARTEWNATNLYGIKRLPQQEDLKQATRRSFARGIRVTKQNHAEENWIGELIRGRSGESDMDEREGRDRSGLCSDCDRMIMGVSFSVADAALALARLLETGDLTARVPLYPHPTRALVWYRYALHHGSEEAAYRLAEAYRWGIGVPRDPKGAVNLYRLAAKEGHARGQFALGICLERGIGTEPDIAGALEMYEAAANAGYPPAQCNLGAFYEYGVGVSDTSVAVAWYTRASNAGLPEAHCRLASCYERGIGTEKDPVKAEQLYEAAAEAGYPYARYRLGVYRQRSIGRKAFIAARNGQTADGEPSNSRYVEAVRLWESAAAEGVAEASYALALSYAYGFGVRVDGNTSIRYLEEAARGGCIQAVSRLGLCRLEGIQSGRNEAEAVALFAYAAELWCRRRVLHRSDTASLPYEADMPAEAAGDAFYMLGYCKITGLGIPPEPSNEKRSFPPTFAEIAGDQTRISGRFMTDVAKGTIHPADLTAVDCFRLAASVGHVGALTALGDLCAARQRSFENMTEHDAEAYARRYYERAAYISAWLRGVTDSLPLTPDMVGDMPLTSDPVAYSTVSGIPKHYLSHAIHRVAAGEGLLFSHADALRDNSIPALLSLCEMDLRALRAPAPVEPETGVAPAADDETPPSAFVSEDLPILTASVNRVEDRTGHAWAYLQACAAEGSVDARVGMAECLYHGYGVPADLDGARAILEEISEGKEPRAAAWLWLGDLWQTGEGAIRDLAQADLCYRKALAAPVLDSEVGPYLLPLRRHTRMVRNRKVRTEALYRLVVLRSVQNTDVKARSEAFGYLVEAMLYGHEKACVDLSRMYRFERDYKKNTDRQTDRASVDRRTLRDRRRAEKLRTSASAAAENGMTVRAHGDWLKNYYFALWSAPKAFCFDHHPPMETADIPSYVKADVTPEMEIGMFNYIGDCLYFGRGPAPDASAAVACYRKAVAVPLQLERGEAPPSDLVWAWYNVGFCLLYGSGTEKRPAEAVHYLTMAANANHAEACLELARCYEIGEGVRRTDLREAVKFYQKAAAAGCTRSLFKINELEQRLKKKQNDESDA